MNPPPHLSQCCKAVAEVHHGDSRSYYYLCTKCGDPCDIYRPQGEVEQKNLVDYIHLQSQFDASQKEIARLREALQKVRTMRLLEGIQAVCVEALRVSGETAKEEDGKSHVESPKSILECSKAYEHWQKSDELETAAEADWIFQVFHAGWNARNNHK